MILQKVIFQMIGASVGWLMFQTTPSVSAQNVASDSVAISKDLEEIVITASEVVRAGDKNIYYPSKTIKRSSGNCARLLGALQISGLIVNPATGDLSLSGNGKLGLRINGRSVSLVDIASIVPEDVERVEFISTPGVKYGDVAGVVDIIVRRRETGFGVMVNTLQSLNRGWGNYSGALKYNSGRSEWTVQYNSNPMWNMDCYRDNTEVIHLEDGTLVKREENGIKAPNRMVTHHASVIYSYSLPKKLFLNIQGRLIRRNDKYLSKGDIFTYCDDISFIGFEEERALIDTWQGDMDVYFHYNINKRNKVFFNIVSSFGTGCSDRFYHTEDLRIESFISSRSFHMLGECMWEGKIGFGSLTAGLRINHGWEKAAYSGVNERIREVEYEEELFAEWRHSGDKLQYSIGIEGMVNSIRRPDRHTFTNLGPRLAMSYRIEEDRTLSLSLNSITKTPTVNQLNTVEQRVDLFQWSRGNMQLIPFRGYSGKIEYEGTFRGIYGKISLTDSYSLNPIMGVKIYEENKIVSSYVNSGYNNEFEIRGNLRLPLFNRRLMCTIEGGWHKIESNGEDYKHSYSQPFINLQLMYINGPWWIMATYNNAYNTLWGEMISTVNQNLMNFGVGYRYRQATFSAGVVNPFGNVALKTKDLSGKASFDRTYQASGSHQLIWLGVSLNLHKGKRRAGEQRRIDNMRIFETINNNMK